MFFGPFKAVFDMVFARKEPFDGFNKSKRQPYTNWRFAERRQPPVITASPMVAGGGKIGRRYSLRDLMTERMLITAAPPARTPEPMVKVRSNVDHQGVMETMSPPTMFAE